MAEIYLNGTFVPPERAQVSVLDRGFLFGDGVYEVIPVYGGRLFRLEEHLARLARSLAAIRLPDPLDAPGWRDMLAELVARNGGGELSLYLQVTRGAAPRDHAFPAQPAATVVAMTSPLPAAEAAPAAAVVVPDLRWQRCDIKAVTLLANVLARQQAREAGAQEAILVRDGALTEGAASNVFVVRGAEVATPPRGPHLLAGITRALVLELLAGTAAPVVERPVPAEELHVADEIWLTSSSREIVPVTRLDGRPVGAGEPGPRWRDAWQRYQEAKQAFPAPA